MSRAHQATCVAIGERAILIEGLPGSGKSSLALALIDRGAVLVGDDGVLLEVTGGRLLASPHPNTAGLIEVRNLGLLTFSTRGATPVALVIQVDFEAPRLPEEHQEVERQGIRLPLVRLWPGAAALPLRAELALDRFGLT